VRKRRKKTAAANSGDERGERAMCSLGVAACGSIGGAAQATKTITRIKRHDIAAAAALKPTIDAGVMAARRRGANAAWRQHPAWHRRQTAIALARRVTMCDIQASNVANASFCGGAGDIYRHLGQQLRRGQNRHRIGGASKSTAWHQHRRGDDVASAWRRRLWHIWWARTDDGDNVAWCVRRGKTSGANRHLFSQSWRSRRRIGNDGIYRHQKRRVASAWRRLRRKRRRHHRLWLAPSAWRVAAAAKRRINKTVSIRGLNFFNEYAGVKAQSMRRIDMAAGGRTH
jgi:hypothetical protein